MRNFLKSLGSILSRILTQIRFVTKFVGGQAVQVAEWTSSIIAENGPPILASALEATGHALSGIGRGIAGVGVAAENAIIGVLGIPIRLARGLLGGGAAPAPEQAAAQAEAIERQRQAASNEVEDDNQKLRALARVAGAMSLGEKPAVADMKTLPEGVLTYLSALSADELDVISRLGLEDLGKIYNRQGVDGVRGGDELDRAQAALASESRGMPELRQIAAVRRIATQRFEGKRPMQGYLDMLPPRLAEYLQALNRDECRLITEMGDAELLDFIQLKEVAPGIRPPRVLGLQYGPAIDEEGLRAERVAAIKEAMRVNLAARAQGMAPNGNSNLRVVR